MSKILHTVCKSRLNRRMCLLLKEQRAKHILLFYQTAVVFQNQSLKMGNKVTKLIKEVLQH